MTATDDVDTIAAVIYNACPAHQRVRPGGDPMDHRDWEDVPFADLPERYREKDYARRRALAVIEYLRTHAELMDGPDVAGRARVADDGARGQTLHVRA
ncbi:hypothetical protein Xcel_3463 (plasmid) [Xylanimonas cellulosilytica DSM 15894]|uniref:Uncharacterized protein n=1 Tax=Xylanimonas cellulosilytica (strain DSM 15894 / JCM 12276 / CECT 5975 / KCTC 9989 / LMG 20990 / NBRC 107835 / XIL07) TaxID=446471 RepID=D1C0Z6_XYLCX|nr:hypothetical protein [Xylanimonas cellulosilytica]ACZ32462.1 hypothetical protein Xcel_3463 [Xylanimonas cellulosilytica DSM 15894]